MQGWKVLSSCLNAWLVTMQRSPFIRHTHCFFDVDFSRILPKPAFKPVTLIWGILLPLHQSQLLPILTYSQRWPVVVAHLIERRSAILQLAGSYPNWCLLFSSSYYPNFPSVSWAVSLEEMHLYSWREKLKIGIVAVLPQAKYADMVKYFFF